MHIRVRRISVLKSTFLVNFASHITFFHSAPARHGAQLLLKSLVLLRQANCVDWRVAARQVDRLFQLDQRYVVEPRIRVKILQRRYNHIQQYIPILLSSSTEYCNRTFELPIPIKLRDASNSQFWLNKLYGCFSAWRSITVLRFHSTQIITLPSSHFLQEYIETVCHTWTKWHKSRRACYW